MTPALAGFVTALSLCPNAPVHAHDVVVVGAGSSGIAAAIQAARRPGTSVALIEEGELIGGQIVAAGVTTMDGGFQPPVSVSGLYATYRDAVQEHYRDFPLGADTCYDTQAFEDTCSEPRVSLDILSDMLSFAHEPMPAGSSLCVALRRSLLGVAKNGNVVDKLFTHHDAAGDEEWRSKVLIDATEYGDVIPLTGAVYRIGRLLSTDPDPLPPAPPNCIGDINYVAIAKQYWSLPPALVMPPAAHGGATLDHQFHSIVYRVPEPPISCYGVSTWPWHQEYRGLPDSSADPPPPAPSRTKSGINAANDYPGQYVVDCTNGVRTVVPRGKLGADFLEDPQVRRDETCAAKLRTLNFVHYMQDPGELRFYGEWGLSDDDYSSPVTCALDPSLDLFETLMPPMPYVRESRRIKGAFTLNAAAFDRPGNWEPTPHRMRHAVALGDYTAGSHNCDDPLTDFEPEEDYANTSGNYGAFQLPFEVFIPEVVDGFLPAEKNLSYTRLAAGAARMQPSTMLVGQAAGAIAALAVAGSQQPRDVRVLDVQKELLRWGAATALDTFVDVPRGHPRWAATQLVSTYDLMTDATPVPGPGLFDFDVYGEAARGASAEALVRAFRISSAKPEPATATFPADVPPGHPQFTPIELMVEHGFDMGGCSVPGGFCPQAPLPRRHLARWLARAWFGPTLPSPPPPTFVDVPSSDGDYRAIEAVHSVALMEECPSARRERRFCPDRMARRGDLAQSLAQVLFTNLALWP